VVTVAPGRPAPTVTRHRATDLARAPTLELPLDDRPTAPVLNPELKGAGLGRELRAGALVLATLAVVGGGVWASGGFEEDPAAMKALEMREAAPTPNFGPTAVLPRSKPVAPVEAPQLRAQASKPSVPELPMEAIGSPSKVVLSSLTHGVDVLHSGFAMQPEKPDAPWALRTVISRSQPTLSRPGVLFAAVLDEQQQLLKLSVVGKDWKAIEGKSARLFSMNAGAMSALYDVALGTKASGVWVDQPGKRRANVAPDALSGVDVRRYLLSDLAAWQSQTLTLRGAPGFALAPVVACFLNHEEFPRGDLPAHQVLLELDKPVTVRNVGSIAFVVPTLAGAPERRAIVEVEPGPLKRAGATVRTPSLEEQADEEESSGLMAEKDSDWVRAASHYDACRIIAPTRERCARAAAAAHARINTFR
jgi:hypothetical protein